MNYIRVNMYYGFKKKTTQNPNKRAYSTESKNENQLQNALILSLKGYDRSRCILKEYIRQVKAPVSEGKNRKYQQKNFLTS